MTASHLKLFLYYILILIFFKNLEQTDAILKKSYFVKKKSSDKRALIHICQFHLSIFQNSQYVPKFYKANQSNPSVKSHP